MTSFSDNHGQSETSSVVESEALAWIAQLNGDDISEKDLAAFREWVNRSPAHQKEIRELSEIWSGLNILTVMDEPIRKADKVSKQLRKNRARQHWKRRLILPASVGALALSAIFIYPLVMTSETTPSSYEASVNVPLVFKTAKGEHQTHTLEDGSIITLNTDSRIEVDYTNGQRNIRLLRGEALFSVAHDEQRPFLVFANDGIVRAVGTEFSVHITDAVMEVIVSEGSVELSTLKPTKPATSVTTKASSSATKVASLGIIRAGHTAQIKNSQASIANVSEDAIDAELSWRVGRLDFTGEGLEEAIEEYTRYSDLNMIITDPKLKDIHVGGSFPIGETDLFLRYLEVSFGIKVEKAADSRIYLSKAN